MRKLLTGLTVLAALAIAGSSHAATGTVDMTWTSCTGTQDITSTTPGVFNIFVSVIGFDQAHQAYESTFIYGDATGGVQDAWRFDPNGCQGVASLGTISHLAPGSVSKVCPSFQGALQSVQVKAIDFVPPSDTGSGYLQTNMRCTLFNAYPNGGAGSPNFNPLVRYFLMEVSFDHSFSIQGPTVDPNVACGGWAAPVCFKLARANYLDLAGSEIPFGRNVNGSGQLIATFNGGAACTAVPARAATWGSIKNQYRN